MANSVLAADNFLMPNGTFIAEVIVFLLILGIIWKYVVPYVQKPMRERQEMIRQQAQDADDARAKLAEAQEAFQKALAEARTEAATIRERARAEAQRSIEELRQTATEEAARIVARGEEQLSSQRAAIVRELRGEIGALAVELSEKIVDQRLADDVQVRATVDAFLTELEQHDDSPDDSRDGSRVDTVAGSQA
ncbi:MAG: F0F1 ATP synthase subunit B [Jatrophihabitans sp.]|nr:MAG: F0F1 ATP synthase subunit B [Jatrophihabitans sp.]